MAPSSTMSKIGFGFLFTTLIGVSDAFQPRDAVPFWGGYTLAHSGSTCPSNTFSCTGSNIQGLGNGYACCPEGTYCFNTGWTYCCPDNTDCGAKLGTNSVCADTNWTLWDDGTIHGPFCCQEGEIAISDPNAPFGECWLAGSPVQTSELATTITQIAVTFLPFSTAGTLATNTAGHTTHPTTTPTQAIPSSTQSVIAAIDSSTSKITLSKTAIIGIAVGGGVFVILLALGVGCCCWRFCCRRRSRKEVAYNSNYEPYRPM